MRIKFLTTLFLSLICFSAFAQQSMITVTKDSRLTKTADLNGKAGVVFLSKSSDLVINTSVRKDPYCNTPEKSGDIYQYTLLLDISGGRDRIFTITKQGTTISEKTGQVLLKGNEYVYFNVETVSNPITMEQENDGSHYIQSGNGYALIEFNSEIQLDINYSKKLNATLKQGRSKAGSYVDSLIVKIDSYKPLYESLENMKTEYNNKQNLIDEKLEKNPNDPDINRLESEVKILNENINNTSRELNEITYISVKGKDTNERIVDQELILGLTSKQKLRFNIMVLLKTETVFKTKYEEMVHQAESHKQSRDYKSAQQFYLSASTAEGATEENKRAAIQSAAKMEELDTFKIKTDDLAGRLFQIIESGRMVNKDKLKELIDDVANRYSTLYYETEDKYYLDESNRLKGEKEKIGFILKGRFVISEYKGGKLIDETITNVDIYGSQYSDCKDMEDKDYKHKGELITTVTATDGRFNLNLQPGQYKTIIFEAKGNKDIKKNKHVSVEGRTDDRNIKIRFPKD